MFSVNKVDQFDFINFQNLASGINPLSCNIESELVLGRITISIWKKKIIVLRNVSLKFEFSVFNSSNQRLLYNLITSYIYNTFNTFRLI